MKYLFILILFFSCYVLKKDHQTLTGRVIEAPKLTGKGYKIRIVTEKQNWTDTQYVFVYSRRYEVGKCYLFSY